MYVMESHTGRNKLKEKKKKHGSNSKVQKAVEGKHVAEHNHRKHVVPGVG